MKKANNQRVGEEGEHVSVFMCVNVCLARERGFLEVREVKVASPNGNHRLDLPWDTQIPPHSSSVISALPTP